MLKVVAAAIIAVSLSSSALAWGQTGHRVTGAIAERYLSADARAAVRAILGPGEGVAEASNWPDFMRSSDEAFWKNEAPFFHYVTVPKGKTYAEVGAPASGDAVTALARFAAVLKNSAAGQDEKRLALRFIIHIIGDLHQPLHAGNGTDQGGNDVKLKFFDKDTNLHSVWDDGMIDHEGLSFTEWTDWLSAKITDEMAREWSSTDPKVWIGESTAIRDNIYPQTDSIAWKYQFDHLDTLRRRLQMGGVRIAVYLNDLFAK
jgi:S1/P1 Nuclease